MAEIGEKRLRLRALFPRLVRKGQYEVSGTSSSPPSASQDVDGAPKDSFHLVYGAFVIGGMGFLIPWSSYLGALDYFFYYYKQEFPSISVAIPIGYLVTTFLASTLNLFLVKAVGIHHRIAFGYAMFVLSLLMIPLLDIGIHNCVISTGVSFYLTIFSISLVGLGSGVQQSSYYGLSSMLPRRYTQAVMAGESVSGVVEIGFRIITKASVRSVRTGAIIFFTFSLFIIIVCILCHIFIRRSRIVIFYTRRCRDRPSAAAVGPGAGLGDGASDLARLIVSSEDEGLSSEEGGNAATTTTTDEQLLLGGDTADVMEMEVVGGGVVENSESHRDLKANSSDRRKFSSKNLNVFKRVVVQIWPLIAAIFAAYFVTLLLFPGLLAEVQNCTLGSWTPILLIAIFNVTDFIAKWLALLPIEWSPKQLLASSFMRLVLIPLVVMCVSPSPASPVFGRGVAVVWAGIFTVVLGLTNGYFGSLPLITASAHVRENKDKELAGTIMTWVLLLALLLGAASAYALTPLTMLQDHQLSCLGNSTSIEFFSACSINNDTATV